MSNKDDPSFPEVVEMLDIFLDNCSPDTEEDKFNLAVLKFISLGYSEEEAKSKAASNQLY